MMMMRRRMRGEDSEIAAPGWDQSPSEIRSPAGRSKRSHSRDSCQQRYTTWSFYLGIFHEEAHTVKVQKLVMSQSCQPSLILSLRIYFSFHVQMDKFESLPDYGNFLLLCCTKSPWLQDANVGSSDRLGNLACDSEFSQNLWEHSNFLPRRNAVTTGRKK